jgi:hypothetical protein
LDCLDAGQFDITAFKQVPCTSILLVLVVVKGIPCAHPNCR